MLLLLISVSLASGQWGDKVGVERERERERVHSLRRGQGTYNPKSAWMFVDSRRRVLPDIDVESHFASVENNILSDIRNFHMKMIQAKVDNTTEILQPKPNQDQYLISSFVPERRRWSSKGEGEWSEEPVTVTVTNQNSWEVQEPQHLVSNNPIIKYDDSTNLVTEDDGLYQTTFHQENYQKLPKKEISVEEKNYPILLRDKTPPERDSYYYNQDNNQIRDQELGGSRPLRRKKNGKNNFFIQNRRLLTEKYFPKEKYFEEYYDENFYGDLEMAYSEPVKSVQPSVENRQLTLGPTTNWAQTFVNGSAVALLAFLFLLNLTQDVIAQITGRRRRRRRSTERDEDLQSEEKIWRILRTLQEWR